jgi:methyl coenzyme M reductase alpha subunit
MAYLSGWKTYICAGVIAIATFAYAMKWIDLVTYNTILGFFGAGGLAALRSAVNKEDK